MKTKKKKPADLRRPKEKTGGRGKQRKGKKSVKFVCKAFQFTLLLVVNNSLGISTYMHDRERNFVCKSIYGWFGVQFYRGGEDEAEAWCGLVANQRAVRRAMGTHRRISSSSVLVSFILLGSLTISDMERTPEVISLELDAASPPTVVVVGSTTPSELPPQMPDLLDFFSWC